MAASAPQIPSMPAGAHVQVNLPHIGLLPATVDSVQGDVVVAVLAVGDSCVKRLEGAEVAIEHATGRGINRYGGRLQLNGARPEELHVTLVGGVERIQRREWARVDATLPVTVKGIDEPVGGATVTLNISGGGILVKDPFRMPLGIDREPMRDQKGIRIDNIAREDEERLVRLVRERELAALRMARGR